MLIVPPDRAVLLAHRAFHLSSSRGGGIVVALDPDGRGSMVDQDGARAFSVPEKPNQIALDASGRFLAVTSSQGLLVLDSSNGSVVARDAGAFEGCQFSDGGEHLWVTRCPDQQHAMVELRDAATLRVQGQRVIADPFHGSSFMVFPNPSHMAAAVWAAAGQDGQCIYWARARESHLAIELLPGMTEVSPPEFALDGTSFLVVVNWAEIRHYSYPDCRMLASVAWPEDDDDPMGDTAVFAGPEHAIATSNNGRTYVLDLRQSILAEELAVAGHEPRAVREMYPALAHDTALCTDLAFLASTGSDTLLSVYRRESSRIRDWQDEIVFWRMTGTETASAPAR